MHIQYALKSFQVLECPSTNTVDLKILKQFFITECLRMNFILQRRSWVVLTSFHVYCNSTCIACNTWYNTFHMYCNDFNQGIWIRVGIDSSWYVVSVHVVLFDSHKDHPPFFNCKFCCKCASLHWFSSNSYTR